MYLGKEQEKRADCFPGFSRSIYCTQCPSNACPCWSCRLPEPLYRASCAVLKNRLIFLLFCSTSRFLLPPGRYSTRAIQNRRIEGSRGRCTMSLKNAAIGDSREKGQNAAIGDSRERGLGPSRRGWFMSAMIAPVHTPTSKRNFLKIYRKRNLWSRRCLCIDDIGVHLVQYSNSVVL